MAEVKYNVFSVDAAKYAATIATSSELLNLKWRQIAFDLHQSVHIFGGDVFERSELSYSGRHSIAMLGNYTSARHAYIAITLLDTLAAVQTVYATAQQKDQQK